jgi:MFS transporter, OFA family, oxalate/formate antiporter
MSAYATSRPTAAPTHRWTQLIIGIVCMVMIANLQYGWTNFVNPIDHKFHWGRAAIQVAFSVFVALETWLTPLDGWLADKLGPKLVVAVGGVFVALGWIINSWAQTLTVLYIGAAVTGVGAGAVYATAVGNSVKWFPDRRGLAVGLTAAGFGAGAALTVIPIRATIAASGYESAFFWFGLVQGAIVFLLAWLLRAPEPSEVPSADKVKIAVSAESYTPQQMLTTPVFWVLYIMFILVSASGLMATAQVAPIATDYGVAKTILLWGTTTIALAQIIDNVCNGAARPLFGWVSDNIGRENTMAIAFGLGGVSYWLLGSLGTSPWAFVLFAALIFLTWGEIFSLFPSTCTDTFGAKYATTNLSFLYTAKGASAFLVPLANVLKTATGNWHAVFVVTAVMNFIVVALALFVLKPLRSRRMAMPARRVAAAG